VATAANKGHWLSELKNEFKTGDPWLRPALIGAAKIFPGDEGAIWIKHIRRQKLAPLEYVISKWIFEEPTISVFRKRPVYLEVHFYG
jgi:hypothetical protein